MRLNPPSGDVMRTLLADVRRSRGCSQTDLGGAIGVSQSLISRWERLGIGKANLEHVVELADFLECAVTDLYERVEVEQ